MMPPRDQGRVDFPEKSTLGIPTTRNERRQLAKAQAERIRFLEVENAELRRICAKYQKVSA